MTSNPNIQTRELLPKTLIAMTPTDIESRPELWNGISDADKRAYLKAFATSRSLDHLSVFDERFILLGDYTLPPEYRYLNHKVETVKYVSASRKYDPSAARTSTIPNALKRTFIDSVVSVDPRFGRKALIEGAASKCQIFPGVNMCLGRIEESVRLKGKGVDFPPTFNEAEKALEDLGIFKDTVFSVAEVAYVNPKSNNGYPVLGKFEDERTHAPIATCKEMLEKVIDKWVNLDLDAFHRQFKNWYTEDVNGTRPNLGLVTFMAKAKAEPVKVSKILGKKARMYTVCPRHASLITQKATQTITDSKKHAIDDPRSHNAQGVSLMYGGADNLISALDAQVQVERAHGRSPVGFLTCGDDTYISVRTPGGMVMTSLDVTNMDLTQRSEFYEPAVKSLARRMINIDRRGTQLWHSQMLCRPVATFETAIYLWDSCLPSGLSLVSEVNGMNMLIIIRRLIAAVGSTKNWENRDIVEGRLEKVANESGFVKNDGTSAIRIEDFFFVPDKKTTAEALTVQPFLFLGAYFHVLPGSTQVVVGNDKPRLLSQMVWSGFQINRKTVNTALERAERATEMVAFEVHEMVRVLSIFLGFGIPLPEHFEAQEAVRNQIITMAKAMMKELEGQSVLHKYDDDLNYWASNIVISDTLNALLSEGEKLSIEAMTYMLETRKDERMWIELKTSSTFLPVDAGVPQQLYYKNPTAKQMYIKIPEMTVKASKGLVITGSQHVGKQKPKAKKQAKILAPRVPIVPRLADEAVKGLSGMSRSAKRRLQGRERKSIEREAQQKEDSRNEEVIFVGGRTYRLEI